MSRTIACLSRLLLALPLLLLSMFVLPGAAHAAPLAQEDTVDADTIRVIQLGAATVYGSFGGGSGAPAASSARTGADDKDVPSQGKTEDGDFVVYSTPEITISFPEKWEVTQGDGVNFTVADEESGLSLQVENFGDDVPGLFMLPLFEGQAGPFAQSMGEDAEVSEISRLMIGADELPALRMVFINADDPIEDKVDGVVYIIAAGSEGYGLYAAAGKDAWQTVGPIVDQIAQGIVVSSDLITLQRAGDEPLEIASEDGAYVVTLPANWVGSVSGDEDLGVLVADPDLAIVGAIGLSPVVDEEEPMLQALLEGIGGELDDEIAASIIDSILDEMDLAGASGVVVDESQTRVFAGAGDGHWGTVRIVGEAPIDEAMILPVTLYVPVYTNRVGAFIFFGAPDVVQSYESEILEVVDSLQVFD